MDRRYFLVSSLASMIPFLPGCGGDSSSSTERTTPPVTGINWTELSSQLNGTLILPSQSEYAIFAPVINTRFNHIKPQAVARCRHVDDIKYTLQFAQKNKLAIALRSGGHGYSGNSICDGIVIDVGLMTTITVNSDGSATVGGGAKLVDVYEQLIAQGVGIPSGSCPTVGIAGITLGGGVGVLDRLYGLSCDALMAADVVTADGVLHHCSETSESDLFWALRGGGGGNFGVVTSLQFKTHTVQDFVVCTANFAFDDAEKVMTAWQQWPSRLPSAIWAQLVFDFRGGVALNAYSQTDISTTQSLWSELLAATQSSPLNQSVTLRSYRDVMLSSCGSLTASQCHRIGQTPDARDNSRYGFVASSDFFNATLPAEGIHTFVQSIQEQISVGAAGYVIVDLMGGAIRQVTNDATAFAHRDALFGAQYVMFSEAAIAPTWPTTMREKMKPWSSGGAYVNYPDLNLVNWKTAYYGENYARLVQLKNVYDPLRVFTMTQGIGT